MHHLTRLHLTHAGQEVATRDWHILLQAQAQIARGEPLPHEGIDRLLWCQPRRDLILVKAPTTLPAAGFPGLADDATCRPLALIHEGTVELALIANPTEYTARGESDGRKRNRPLSPDRWGEWLARHLDGAVDLHEVATEALGAQRVTKPGRRVTHTRVGFHAVGNVLDPALLARAILCGVGRGKAYGCGLLLVAGSAS